MKRLNVAGNLVIIGTNPPTTSGALTLQRAALASELLDADSYQLINIFAKATYRTGDIATCGASAEHWHAARPALSTAVEHASAVLLAYGTTLPSGSAGRWFKSQTIWLDNLLGKEVPILLVGGAPRHPSRWHRYTHHHFPLRDFKSALAQSFVLRV